MAGWTMLLAQGWTLFQDCMRVRRLKTMEGDMVKLVQKGLRTYELHDGLPEACPSEMAKPVAGPLYRGIKNIKKMPLSESTFFSHRKLNIKCDEPECECWGLSVWLTRDAVTHALNTFDFMKKKWHIAYGELNNEDGLILHTPSEAQPEHHTFWRDTRREFAARFHIVIYPGQ